MHHICMYSLTIQTPSVFLKDGIKMTVPDFLEARESWTLMREHYII